MRELLANIGAPTGAPQGAPSPDDAELEREQRDREAWNRYFCAALSGLAAGNRVVSAFGIAEQAALIAGRALAVEAERWER